MIRIQSYRSPKAKLCHSKVHGTGNFAKETIAKGELVWIRSGHIVNYRQAKQVIKKLGDYCLPLGEEQYLTPKYKHEVADIAVFANHSCEPNIGYAGEISLVAMRDIKPNEELTVDYAMFHSIMDTFDCQCGKALCRGTITNIDWQLPHLQKKYHGYFSTYITKKIQQQPNISYNEYLARLKDSITELEAVAEL